MSRNMTQAEKDDYKTDFPNLDVDRTIVTDERTKSYNCVAWTIGSTGAFIWPGDTIQRFDLFYEMCGFERAASGSIAAWGIDESQMKHASVSGPNHGPRWESKCGPSLRIQHDLNELVSSLYGTILVYYERTERPSLAVTRAVEAVSEGRFAVPTSEQIAIVRAAAQAVPAALRTRFEAGFAAWKATWSKPPVVFSSNPKVVSDVEEFRALVALGPEILPAIVEKLLEPDNFFALQLYDSLQPQPDMVVPFDLSSDYVFEGEQGRARRTVERFASGVQP
jgi:hypothetical protein